MASEKLIKTLLVVLFGKSNADPVIWAMQWTIVRITISQPTRFYKVLTLPIFFNAFHNVSHRIHRTYIFLSTLMGCFFHGNWYVNISSHDMMSQVLVVNIPDVLQIPKFTRYLDPYRLKACPKYTYSEGSTGALYSGAHHLSWWSKHFPPAVSALGGCFPCDGESCSAYGSSQTPTIPETNSFFYPWKCWWLENWSYLGLFWLEQPWKWALELCYIYIYTYIHGLHI